MTVMLNGETLDVTFENEKTVFDVVESLSKELNKKEIIITSINLDNKNYNIDDDELNKIYIEKIKSMDVEASTKEELVETLLEECKKVLGNIAADIRENSFTHAGEFSELLAWVKETLETINRLAFFNLAEAKLITSTIDQIKTFSDNEDRDKTRYGSIVSIIESLIKYIDALRFKFSANYSISREEILEAVGESLTILPEISEAFQMGKDREAFDKINKIISVLEICSVYLRKNYDKFSDMEKTDIGNLYEDINVLLTRIVEAFENSDAVLLGDLLEYELPEKLESYKRIILKG